MITFKELVDLEFNKMDCLVNGAELDLEVIKHKPNFFESKLDYYDYKETEAYNVKKCFCSDDFNNSEENTESGYLSEITASTDEEFTKQFYDLTTRELDNGKLLSFTIDVLELNETEYRLGRLPSYIVIDAIAFKNKDSEYVVKFTMEDNLGKILAVDDNRSELLEALIELCSELRMRTFTLEVDTENEPAIHLYEKFGFSANEAQRLRIMHRVE